MVQYSMLRHALVFLASAAVLQSTSALAEPASNPAPPPLGAAEPAAPASPVVTSGEAAPPSADEPNERVCRRVEQLGSRLRTTRICRSAEEWRILDERARSQVRGLQNRSGNVVNAERGG
jgi:hypothetical protein